MVYGLKFRDWVLELRVDGIGFRIWVLGSKVWPRTTFESMV